MSRSWLLERLQQWDDREALAGDGGPAGYGALRAEAARWVGLLAEAGVAPGRVVAFEGESGLRSVALLLALIELGAVAVPLGPAAGPRAAEYLAIAEAEFLVEEAGPGPRRLEAPSGARHPLLGALAATGRAGLVLFSSGSTGRPKAILHDLDRLLEKFRAPRPARRMLSFLLIDHIGGINTILHGLASGGTVVTVRDRSPARVCEAIARHRVEVLPSSPSFLGLLLLSGEHQRHDLTSLRLITYGTEVMPSGTLARLHEAFPGVRLQQTYGLSELGILASRSRDDGSLWVQVGGDGYETRIVDGTLRIRAQFAMLGYLNAPSPFDADGWFDTQDVVEQDGEWLRFLGRRSEVINVAGQKVHPAEVEDVLLGLDGVVDVTVRGESSPLVGQYVVARVSLSRPEPVAELKARLRRYCQGRLAPYMIPARVEIAEGPQANARGKRIRAPGGCREGEVPQ